MKKVILIASVVTISSCAQFPEKKLESTRATLAGKSLQVVVGKTPDFNLMTGGTVATWALLGPIGNIAAVASASSNGAALIRENHIADPSIKIANNLSKELEKSYNLQLASAEPVMLQTSDQDIISQMYKDSDYILVIEKLGWGTTYNLPGSLAVVSNVHMQLKEVSSGNVIAESLCYKKPDYKYGLDELRDNGASKLKEILTEEEHDCTKQFYGTFGINGHKTVDQ